MKQLSLVFLRSIDPVRNRFRFYSLRLDRDLWGQRTLIRRYGRIGTNGHIYVESVSNISDAKKRMSELVEAKMKRGYLPGSPFIPRPFKQALSDHTQMSNN